MCVCVCVCVRACVRVRVCVCVVYTSQKSLLMTTICWPRSQHCQVLSAASLDSHSELGTHTLEMHEYLIHLYIAHVAVLCRNQRLFFLHISTTSLPSKCCIAELLLRAGLIHAL